MKYFLGFCYRFPFTVLVFPAGKYPWGLEAFAGGKAGSWIRRSMKGLKRSLFFN